MVIDVGLYAACLLSLSVLNTTKPVTRAFSEER